MFYFLSPIGSWLNWSRWSPWTKCGIGSKIGSQIGVRSRKRIREKYSRQKSTTLTLNDKLLINFFFDNHTSDDSPNPDWQINSEACEMPQPTGLLLIDVKINLSDFLHRCFTFDNYFNLYVLTFRMDEHRLSKTIEQCYESKGVLDFFCGHKT